MHKPYHPCRYCQLSKMADDKQEKGKLARLTERLTAGAPPTPEQIEESQRNRKALLGTARQWAELLPTNIIAIDISQCSPGWRKSHGVS